MFLLLGQVGKAVQLHVHSSFPLMEIHYVVSTSVILTDVQWWYCVVKKIPVIIICSVKSQKFNFFRDVSSACVKVNSRGQLVSAGTANTALLTLLPEFSWAPRPSIIVYCVHSSGEIVSDVAQLHVVKMLRNWVSHLSPTSQWHYSKCSHSYWTTDVSSTAWQVSLSWSRQEVEPDEDVTLRMEVVEPASLVAVLVVDKATKWAGSQNDITIDAVRAPGFCVFVHINPPVGSCFTVWQWNRKLELKPQLSCSGWGYHRFVPCSNCLSTYIIFKYCASVKSDLHQAKIV